LFLLEQVSGWCSEVLAIVPGMADPLSRGANLKRTPEGAPGRYTHVNFAPAKKFQTETLPEYAAESALDGRGILSEAFSCEEGCDD